MHLYDRKPYLADPYFPPGFPTLKFSVSRTQLERTDLSIRETKLCPWINTLGLKGPTSFLVKILKCRVNNPVFA